MKLGVALLEDMSGDKVPVGAETPEEKTPASKGTSCVKQSQKARRLP